MDIVLITSVINTPNIPLSYIETRSIYSKSERFDQTKRTIETVKQKIPNSIIFLIECSQIDEEQRKYIQENTNIFVNIFDTDNINIINNIFSQSKSLGEGSMTIYALQYLKDNNISYNNLYKISGRYWLSNLFNYDNFNNKNIIIKYINSDENNCFTALYKLPNEVANNYLHFLKENMQLMEECIGYEVLFALFLRFYKSNIMTKSQNIDNCYNSLEYINIVSYDPIGLCGNVSVSNEFYTG